MSEKRDTLPQGWEWKKLGDIAFIKGGKRVPKGKKLTEQKTEHPYIRVSDFSDDGTIDTSKIQYITKDIYNEIKNYTITCKDLYISIAGTIGKTGIIPKELDGANLTENAVKLVYKIQEIENKFVYLFTLSNFFKEQAGLATKVVAMPKLAISRLSEIQIPLPSLEEQRRIVGRLDGLFAKIDASIALLDANIASATSLMPSALNEVFEELGEKWEKKKLNQILKEGGKTISTLEHPNLIYFSLEDIEAQSGKILKYQTVLQAGVKGTAVMFDANCVLYSKLRPYLNKVVVSDCEGCSTTELVVLKPLSILNEIFLAYILRSPKIVNFLHNDSMGAKMPRTNMKTFRELEIPLPPLDIQTQTVAYLDALHVKAQALKKVQQTKKEELLALKASLLESAFKGEL